MYLFRPQRSKVKKFRGHNGKDKYLNEKSDESRKRFGKYKVGTFCMIFCDANEYAERMEVEVSAIKALVAIALKGDKKQGTNKRDIAKLQALSKKYKISQMNSLLKEFHSRMNYSSECTKTDEFYHCVVEFICRYNKDDWEF